MSMEKIEFDKVEGRGRNGWFRAREAAVWTSEFPFPLAGDKSDEYIPAPVITVDVSSRRGGDTAPVVLRFSTQDAVALATAILKAAGELPVYAISKDDIITWWGLENCEDISKTEAAFYSMPPERQQELMDIAVRAIQSVDHDEWVREAWYATDTEAIAAATKS